MLPITTAQPQGWFGEMTSCLFQIGPQGTTPLPLPVVESSLGVDPQEVGEVTQGVWQGLPCQGPAHWWRWLATSVCRASVAERPQTAAPQGPQSPLVPFYFLTSGDKLTFCLSVVVLLLRGLK